MKKKLLKLLTIGTISINMISTSAFCTDINKDKLVSYNTNQAIYLNGGQIQLPKTYDNQKEQFRGVWVSSVYNLDFPSKKKLNEKDYKAEYIKVLDNLQKLNMNAVIFQVRPKLDTFYKSSINPWSEYLTGTQGVSPNWDPLTWMIEETHKRGMEFHAWFNPYRVTVGKEKLSDLAQNNWARKNPDKVLSFDGKLYLNPAEPEVINHINDSVMEVVKNYDIDAVHFDDYFYPYGNKQSQWFDQKEKVSFEKYGQGFTNIDDWRRDNVDRLIQTLHNSIESYNDQNQKSVELGISPFGIWGHKALHPDGSSTPTSSLSSYDKLYADTKKWVENNWIDYIAPQIYWTFDTKAAPYGELADWWANVVKDTNTSLYIGHASYKLADVNNKDISWKNPQEIINQLKFNSMYDEINGSIFFRYKTLLEDTKSPKENNEFIKILKEKYFSSKVNVPSKNEKLAKNITPKLD